MSPTTSQPLARFFASAVQPFFLFTGAGTALIGLYAFWPAWAMPNVARLPYLQEYTIIIQHWGMMVWLVLSNAQQPFVSGFWLPCALDATVVLFTIGYFAVCGFDQPPQKSSEIS